MTTAHCCCHRCGYTIAITPAAPCESSNQDLAEASLGTGRATYIKQQQHGVRVSRCPAHTMDCPSPLHHTDACNHASAYLFSALPGMTMLSPSLLAKDWGQQPGIIGDLPGSRVPSSMVGYHTAQKGQNLKCYAEHMPGTNGLPHAAASANPLPSNMQRLVWHVRTSKK
jgi:hypothetical protein